MASRFPWDEQEDDEEEPQRVRRQRVNFGRAGTEGSTIRERVEGSFFRGDQFIEETVDWNVVCGHCGRGIPPGETVYFCSEDGQVLCWQCASLCGLDRMYYCPRHFVRPLGICSTCCHIWFPRAVLLCIALMLFILILAVS